MSSASTSDMVRRIKGRSCISESWIKRFTKGAEFVDGYGSLTYVLLQLLNWGTYRTLWWASGLNRTHSDSLKGAVRMKPVRWLLPLLFLFSATSLLAQKAEYTFDKTADFSKYKTYRWEQHPLMKDINPTLLSELGAAFDAALVKSGLTKATNGPADLVIVYMVGVDNEMDMTTYAVGWMASPAWGGVWYSNGMITSSTTSSV